MVLRQCYSEFNGGEFEVEGGDHLHLCVDQVLARPDDVEPESIHMIRGLPLRVNILRNPQVILSAL